MKNVFSYRCNDERQIHNLYLKSVGCFFFYFPFGFLQGIYGLEEAVAEIKDLKKQIKIRDHEIESLIKEVNKLEFKINDFLDENEDLRERLGMLYPLCFQLFVV